MNHLEGLNTPQKEAVITTDGPVLVVAGAGAGKTRVITHRIAHIVSQGIEPSSILAVTFTNKAAKEMKERALSLLSQEITPQTTPFISTFHSLGVYILRNHHKTLNIPKHFTIFDRDDSVRAIKQALKKKGLNPKEYEPRKILSSISKKKGDGITFEEFSGHTSNYWDELVADIWEEYEHILTKNKAFDFDDLLLKTVSLLKKEKAIREQYQQQWKYIHIDEYQDTNGVQYEFVKLITNNENNICVVGDGDQLVYSWRGADIKNILSFEKDFSNTTTILLEENYRSTKNILGAANNVIKKNNNRIDKNLFTSNSEGEPLELIEGWSEANEAEKIVTAIQELIKEGTNPNEIAILYRANFQSRVLEEALLRSGVSYQLIGTKFFDRKEVKDVLSYIKCALNPDSLPDLSRIINTPTRGIGKITLAKVIDGEENTLSGKAKESVSNFRSILKKIQLESEKCTPSELVKFTLKTSGLEDLFKKDGEDGLERLENIHELASLAARYDHLPREEQLSEFLTDVALASDQDEMIKEGKGAVKMMTVHASKGLEFDYVFITGLEEGLFPHEKLDDSKTDDEEERRLFYVAITRARKKVFLSFAHSRMIYGSTGMRTPSSFIDDIGNEFIAESESVIDEDTDTKRKKGIDAIFDIDF